jgi:drug/metabolite transporter (DMT)-like permease
MRAVRLGGFLFLGIISSSFYALSYILVRAVGKSGIHAFEIAFVRTLICALVLIIVTLRVGMHIFTIRKPHVIVVRGLLSAAGLLLWFYGLVYLPMAEAMTLSLTTVCFASLGAALFLGEPITGRRAAAMLLAIAGAVAIIRPGSAGVQIEALAVVAAAACWGAAACLVRSARAENPLTIALWSSLIIAVFSLPLAMEVWTWPSASDWLLLVLVGILSAAGTLAWTAAFRHGQTAQVMLTDFVQLAWGVAISLAAGEFIGTRSIFGFVLIGSAIALVGLEKPSKTPT